MMKKVVIVGAGGKMGMRITHNLKNSDYSMSYLEVGPAGIERLKGIGLNVSVQTDVVPAADIVVLAVPDIALGKVSANVIPAMKSGALAVTLDPAAALAGKLFHREDVGYFVTHPTHPSVFNWEPNPEAQRDFFGGTLAKQSVVCSLMQGPDEMYKIGEELACRMYAPVKTAHRITVEQMGILEPALVETLCSTCISVVREALDMVIKMGVPEEAARDFLYGHINIQLGVLFNQIPGGVFSDAANKAIIYAMPQLFKEDWKKVFDKDNIQKQIKQITE
jgi:D-apionate oxidoisomerase